MTTTRRAKARQGYDLISQAAAKVETLLPCELFRVARAINPKLEDYQGRYVIYVETRWTDGNTPGSLKAVFSEIASLEDFSVRRAFVFWSEHAFDREGRLLKNRMHLVYEFPAVMGAEVRAVALHCGTGLPVTFECTLENRTKYLSAERRLELTTFESEVRSKARAELVKIEAEKCSTLFWQIDNERSTIDQHVEVFQELVRPNSKAEYRVKQELAWKYFPSDAREVAA